MVTLTPEWMDPESLDMSMVGLDHILRILVSDEEFNDDVAAHNVQSHRLPSIDFHLQSRRALQESYMEVPRVAFLKPHWMVPIQLLVRKTLVNLGILVLREDGVLTRLRVPESFPSLSKPV